MRVGVVAGIAVLSWLGAGAARAHPILHVETDPGGTVHVSCGPDRSTEAQCFSEDDPVCEDEPVARVCRPVVDSLGRSFCLGPSDAFCCDPGSDENSECPLVEGYDVRCVEVMPTPDGSGIVVEEGVAFCVYDREGTSACADRIGENPEVALKCHSQPGEVGQAVAAEIGDCDLDGLPNTEDPAPCDPGMVMEEDAGTGPGPGPGPGGAEGLRWRGAGGCDCRVAGARPGVGILAFGIALSISWLRARGGASRRARARDRAAQGT
jgi:hypothetical protein